MRLRECGRKGRGVANGPAGRLRKTWTLWADTDHSRSKRQHILKADEEPGKEEKGQGWTPTIRGQDGMRWGWGEPGRLVLEWS